ncbi:MAG: YihY/virulence factor BrkB family protein [Myxococcales bacterium]|nr:YihY/virulence factor BrkB family protein [Myxococcales bacterium]HRC56577.1 YihY/virulence factor BrkB family protein [Kofleriaceae bacterium]
MVTVVRSWLHAARSALLGGGPVLAAGTALFAILAAMPTLAAVVALYGLVSDAHSIESHLAGLDTVLPVAVVTFVIGELERQASQSTGQLSLTLVTSLVVAVYSARSAAGALMEALNQAYRVRDHRHPLLRIGITLGIASSTLLGFLILMVVLVALPAVVAILPVLRDVGDLANWLRWPVLFAVVFCAQAALYRVAPAPRPLVRRRIWSGALVATGLWLLASYLLSLWVDKVADYQVFYGAFASVVVVILWFYFSVLAIVIGGFVNAELERSHGAPDPSRSMV